MITDRNKGNFVAICCWLSFLLMAVTLAQTEPEISTYSTEPQQSIDDQSPLHIIINDGSESTGHANGRDFNVNTNVINSNSNNDNDKVDGGVRAFNPRVDYNNEWRPVGRGDPLKNDPTFDYSPPTLEHVRYWADSKDKEDSKEGNPTTKEADHTQKANKNEVLLLGMPSQRYRGAMYSSGAAYAPMQQPMKNAKGEMPLLQPKYTSVRRSYYAQQQQQQQQLPTHLMPPPMQTISPSSYNMNGMMKPTAAHTEYRHGHISSPPSPQGMSRPAYSTTSMSTAPWMQASSLSNMPHYSSTRYRTPSIYDSFQQESAHHASYSRPSTMSAMQQYESYQSPNSIRSSASSVSGGKQTTHRKPWLHELLQKEVIKPVKQTSTKYQMGTTKPIYERMPASVGISTTYAPVAFMTTSTYTTPPPYKPLISITASPNYKLHTTPTPTATPATTPPTTTTRAFYPTPQTTPPAPSTTTSRLLIPTGSNLVSRPTVEPLEMTTDSLFSHYNQPDKPLRGPMYLIIEGHSKVKKYGKNEINLKLPKIVPVVSKREPVVRFADPNDQPESLDTYQVKHLHTKSTSITTTPMPVPFSTTTESAATQITSSTKETVTKLKFASANNATTTVQPPPTGMQGLLNLLDESLGLNGLIGESEEKVETTMQENSDLQVTTLSTILKPVPNNAKPEPLLEVHERAQNNSAVGAQAVATEMPASSEDVAREVRQVYDYDQLPELRMKNSYSMLYEDYDEPPNNRSRLIKHLDSLIVGSEEEKPTTTESASVYDDDYSSYEDS